MSDDGVSLAATNGSKSAPNLLYSGPDDREAQRTDDQEHDQLPDDDSDPGVIIVSCGNKKGRLHMRLFECPGIHQMCIEVDGQYMTPKAFCIMGEKERLKDWKNAIRINGKSIRKQMDSGQLDFYKHNEICTGRCMSRNSKYDVKIENLSQHDHKNEYFDYPSLVPYSSPLGGAAYNILRNVSGESPGRNSPNGSVVFPGMDLEYAANVATNLVIKQEKLSDSEDKDSGIHVSNILPTPCSVPQSVKAKQPTKHRRKNALPKQVAVNGCSKTSPPPPPVAMETVNVADTSGSPDNHRIMEMVSEFPDTETLLEDSVTFWRGIQEIGLLDNVIRDAKHALENLKNDLQHDGVQESDARKLSNVVSNLGLVTKIKWRMAEHRSRTESEREKLTQEILNLKRKVTESEEKQRNLNRRSQCFESLLEGSRQKRMKLDAPSSTTSGPCDEDSAYNKDDSGNNNLHRDSHKNISGDRRYNIKFIDNHLEKTDSMDGSMKGDSPAASIDRLDTSDRMSPYGGSMSNASN